MGSEREITAASSSMLQSIRTRRKRTLLSTRENKCALILSASGSHLLPVPNARAARDVFCAGAEIRAHSQAHKANSTRKSPVRVLRTPVPKVNWLSRWLSIRYVLMSPRAKPRA